MKTKILKNAAKILVACEYAERWSLTSEGNVLLHWEEPDLDGVIEYCNPFAVSSIGRCQADEIDDWFYKNCQCLLITCNDNVQKAPLSEYNCRLDRLVRMKWCIDNIPKSEMPA